MQKSNIIYIICIRYLRRVIYKYWGYDILKGVRKNDRVKEDYFLTIKFDTKNGIEYRHLWEVNRFYQLESLTQEFHRTKKEEVVQNIISQISKWCGQNPYEYGPNWTSAMEVAIRAANWLRAYSQVKGEMNRDREFLEMFVNSLHQHGRYIEENLEVSLRHPTTNHYLSNLAGLVYLSILFPELKHAARWRSFALQELEVEVSKQILPDGVSFENSISYHRYVLELLLFCFLLCKNAKLIISDVFQQRIEKMLEFILLVMRPDGKVPLTGDADDSRWHITSNFDDWDRQDYRYLLAIGAVLFRRGDFKHYSQGQTADLEGILGMEGVEQFQQIPGDSTPLNSRRFEFGGVYIMRREECYLGVVTANRHSHREQVHKHNDVFSFELCVGEAPFVIDPGTFCYLADRRWRNYFRSTAAHNTVRIDGLEINRLDQGSFSLPRDSHIEVLEWRTGGEVECFQAQHSGYRRLPDPVWHNRRIEFDTRANIWRLTDLLHGSGSHTMEWFFHFSPEARVELGGNLCRVTLNGRKLDLEIPEGLDAAIEDSWVSFQFGTKVASKQLRCRTTGTMPQNKQFVLRAVN